MKYLIISSDSTIILLNKIPDFVIVTDSSYNKLQISHWMTRFLFIYDVSTCTKFILNHDKYNLLQVS